MIEAISVVASLFNILSGASYFRQVLKGQSTPNPATWLIWFVVTILNTLTYFLVVSGNIWVSLNSIALAAIIFVIFLLSLFKGKFTKLGAVEIISLVIALAVGAFWQITGNSVLSNLALQGIFLVSFYPTVHGLLFKDALEKPMPWFLAVASYSLQIANVFLNPVTLIALAFPITNLIGNGLIGLLAMHPKKS